MSLFGGSSPSDESSPKRESSPTDKAQRETTAPPSRRIYSPAKRSARDFVDLWSDNEDSTPQVKKQKVEGKGGTKQVEDEDDDDDEDDQGSVD